jgi:transposase-like protein
VIDGAKALTSAIEKIFGPLAAIQRCQIHKRRNILGHLPERIHANVKAVLQEAWSLGDAEVAKRRLERLASSLEAEKKFRRVQGWRDIKKLVQALTAIEQQQEAKAKRVA